MFFYDNQLDLQDYLPVNHVSTIRQDCTLSTSGWIGCRDGQVHRLDLNNKQATVSLQMDNERTVADLVSCPGYLFCLSKNSVQLFNLEQSSNFTLSGSPDSHTVQFNARTALNNLCSFEHRDQHLLAGCQNEVYLFDVNQLKVVEKYTLFETPSSCIKMRRVASKSLIVTASVGGHITVYDESNFQPLFTYRPFKSTIFDFDLINDDFIVTTGFDCGYSSGQTRDVNIFDLRNQSEMVMHDDTRFYGAHYVKGLLRSGYCLTLNKCGIGELNCIKDGKSFQSKGKHFSIELRPNSTIGAFETSADGGLLMSGDKNGYLHLTSLQEANPPSRHIKIDDIQHNSSADHLATCDEDDEMDFIDTNRNFKIRPHFFLTQTSDEHLANWFGDSPLKNISSSFYNH